ncbi:Golgi transport complex subunit 3 [Coemansia furcata]|uniref:Golgi transport complex subunit 3 n=1 Tax=Coemansia furcata TaxID=417177 RepID=A0ACC1LSB5_9FUNG|nr:Golgi transport complex subunit 3 [Coemansia furcata]
MTSIDDWDKRFPVSEGLRLGIGLLQDACASFTSQLVEPPQPITTEASEAAAVRVNGNVDKPSLGGKLNPQLQHLRASPQLRARRNASLRNLTVLARAASPSLRPAVGGAAELGALGMLNGSSEAEPPLTGGGVMGAMETPAQFLEWYGRVEEAEAAGQDAEALAFASQLRERVSQCSQMLGCVDEISSLLSAMEADYQRVCQQTAGVEAACASLSTQRSRLEGVAGEIGEQLAVYNWLGPITRLLHAPGDRVCEDPEFLPSLSRAEEAMRFIASRVEEAKDSELYLMRFAQCRMRALSLIKMHALRALKALGAFDAKGPAVYVHYRAAAVALGPLLRALQQRATQPTERQVLADVQNAYFAARRAWLRPHIQARLRDIAAEHDAEESGVLERRVGALRDWCAFMMAVCGDESRLYRDFFDGGSEGEAGLLRPFLDAAMTLFHEQVRPLIIHEADVAVLAGLSLTLLTYNRLPPSASEASSAQDEGGEDEGGGDDEDGLDAFYAVVGHVLQDTQHRLAYKAQSYIRAHIGGYRIGPSDTDAMARWVRLCLRLRIADPAQLSALLDVPGDLPPEDAEGLQWTYPPVESCRWLIAQIDGCLDYEVQSGVVDEARTAAKQNLLSTGARFVRDSSIKAESPTTEKDAELMAHLFATHNLAAIEDSTS